jgi:twitching motility protein PilT
MSNELSIENAKSSLNQWLQELLKKNGSILHIKNNSPIKGRIQNTLQIIDKTPLNSELLKIILKLLAANNLKMLMDEKEYEGIYKLDTKYRFKFRIYTHQNGFAVVFKALPSKIKTLKELHLPSTLNSIVELEQGLVILSGDDSSGKSTLLATLLEAINQKKSSHIITLEDHIEYIYNEKLSTIEQKETKIHTLSISQAIKSIIKEDPDIIAIDQLSDSDVARHIIELINRGYLIIITMNATDTQDTISKFLEFFDATQQDNARHTLAYMLKAVISQELIISKDNILLPVVEIMFQTENTKNAILNYKESMIKDVILNDSKQNNSITFEQSLHKLYTAGQISQDRTQEHLLQVSKVDKSKPLSKSEFVLEVEDPISYTIKV